MKVGILTFHRSHNYGAVLQAFALLTTLNKLGHQAEIIDYWPKYREGQYNLFDFKIKSAKNDSLPAKAKKYIKQVFSLPYWSVKYVKFNSFIKDNLNVKGASFGSGTGIPAIYDVIVCGSDQIWRYNFRGIGGFDEVYFAMYPQTQKVKKISYAASMGDKDLDDEGLRTFQELIKNFDAVSVREETLLALVQPLTRSTPVKVVDPVFLLPEQAWRKMLRPYGTNKKYLLYYQLLRSVEAKKLAQKIARERGLELVDIRGAKETVSPFDPRNRKHTTGPLDFITLIANADYIVSTSYHGVAFSIIFQKQFAAIGFRNQGHRIKSLLKALDLEQNLIEDSSGQIPAAIDYARVNGTLERLVKDSQAFLHRNLQPEG